MAQFLRPDSNITQTNTSGGFADIDESTASNTDFARSLGLSNGETARLETGLSNPGGTPGAGTTTIRYRGAKLNSAGSALSSDGRTVNLTVHVYEGATLRASDTARTLSGTWTDYSFAPDLSAISDWNDVRLRFDWVGSGGGGGTSDRCGGVSWAEIEIPNASVTTTVTPSTGHQTTSGKVPSITQSANLTLAPTSDHLVYSGKAPTVSQTITTTVAPAKGALTFSGQVATVTQSTTNTLNPSQGAISVTGRAPTVSQSSGTAITPIQGSLSFSTYAPTVLQSAHNVVAPLPASAFFSGQVPVVVRTTHNTVEPAQGQIVFIGNTPTISFPGSFVPSTQKDWAAISENILTKLGLPFNYNHNELGYKRAVREAFEVYVGPTNYNNNNAGYLRSIAENICILNNGPFDCVFDDDGYERRIAEEMELFTGVPQHGSFRKRIKKSSEIIEL